MREYHVPRIVPDPEKPMVHKCRCHPQPPKRLKWRGVRGGGSEGIILRSILHPPSPPLHCNRRWVAEGMGEGIVRLECLVRKWRIFPYVKIYKGWSFAERDGEGKVRIFYSCAYSWQQVEQFLAHTWYFWNDDCRDGFLMGMKEWRTEWPCCTCTQMAWQVKSVLQKCPSKQVLLVYNLGFIPGLSGRNGVDFPV